MAEFVDQIGNKISLDGLPERIISLVPSQTELLYFLGLEKEVVGITKFCVHPKEWFNTKTRVGGTKQVDHEKIKQLKPDLIIANKEENVKEQVLELSAFAPVWTSDVNNLDEALEMINSVGALTGRQEGAAGLVREIMDAFNDLSAPMKTRTAAYLIWTNPFMAAGGNTFISDMMHRAGWRNVFGERNRYPETTIEELRQLKPDVIMLSSEPYPFKENHRESLQEALKDSRVILVDGEMFSWYGSRMKLAARYFSSLI